MHHVHLVYILEGKTNLQYYSPYALLAQLQETTLPALAPLDEPRKITPVTKLHHNIQVSVFY